MPVKLDIKAPSQGRHDLQIQIYDTKEDFKAEALSPFEIKRIFPPLQHGPQHPVDGIRRGLWHVLEHGGVRDSALMPMPECGDRC